MEYTVEVEIDLSLEDVIGLFDNPDHWPKWRDGFVSVEPVPGTPGSEGSVTKLVNRVGGRDTEIVETVESKHLPEEMTCIYEARGFWYGPWNKVTNRFRELSQGKSEWKMECEFCCRGFVKVISCLMSCLMPGMFRKATLNEMTRFKAFAEEAKGI